MFTGRGTGRRIVVVASHDDAVAATTADLLRTHASQPALLVDESTLSRARVVHRPASGPAASKGDVRAVAGDALTLPDGTVLDAASCLIWWRLPGYPAPLVAADHRDYAAAETHALGLSWLAGLGQAVVNAPHPTCLAGLQPSLLQLGMFARQAGLRMARFALASSATHYRRGPGLAAACWDGLVVPTGVGHADKPRGGPPLPQPLFLVEELEWRTTMLVVGNEVAGPRLDLREQLVQLARLADLACAEVSLGEDPGTGEAVVTGLSPIPELTQVSQLTAMVRYLERRAEAPAMGVVAS
ncbi:hypothetical protein [Tessaracoccus caeni]|uniref:hypothetical protein n=1 Tax=Tessaracoccus caeni TaxID=3031239 RepID=UPI0023DAA0C4|nr:hypothetical protein [Tessaracoccus caeni]MDF1489877.1 hypothetical protein [Tessaracoccus caeni]